MRRSFSGKSEENIGIFAFRILQNLTLTCQALEKVSYILGRSSDPSPSRGPVVPRLPCVRHPLIMFAFLSTFFCDKVLLTIFLSDLDKMKERKEKEGWFGSKCFFSKKGVGVGSCRDHLLSQRSAIARRKRHWDSPCIRTTFLVFLKQIFLLHSIYNKHIHYRHWDFPCIRTSYTFLLLEGFLNNLYTLGLSLHSNNFFLRFWTFLCYK